MQLGFVSAIFGDLSLEQVLRHASDIGYDCVEVMCWPPGGPDRKHGGVMHIDVTEFSQAQADNVLALCEKYRVGISALGYYSVPLSADVEQAKAACEHIPKVIDAAVKLGLGNVNSFVGANHTLSLEENFKKFAEVWPALVKHAEDKNIRIGIENCPMLFENSWPTGLNLARSPAIWRRMFEVIPSPNFGLNYDPSHLEMQLMDPIAPIQEFGSRIFHTHAKDMRVNRDELNDMGSLVVPMQRSTAKIPGLGDINWGKWIAALTDVGFDGAVCVEVEDEAFEGSVERRLQSLAISHNVLRPLIA
ncbi:sugar phosphate isomerase/epimerase family protein [Bythopirellula polymerisocia]|uniref:Inosose dehydratase n=1 Tax=Bythopirellula polymerisocia TaxID=2528003 RepID=A0A5C6CWA7_9BACT|nr:sugar phosphate isomerase/epimerase [Bythopirellula polymerisocia]TWU28145.1 Inosose dehydratase [Bythopirellula polymerisocia]